MRNFPLALQLNHIKKVIEMPVLVDFEILQLELNKIVMHNLPRPNHKFWCLEMMNNLKYRIITTFIQSRSD
jgi:hypothetical protein